MQRLFSTFPNSWPGLGLLILRLGAAFSLLESARLPAAAAQVPTLLLRAVSAVDGVLLLAGLWTPFAGIAMAAVRWGASSIVPESTCAALFDSAVGLALAMLGPGAWSLDARLFGRKRII